MVWGWGVDEKKGSVIGRMGIGYGKRDGWGEGVGRR
jgi:hypothetical protein